jgi:hypothetical protein
MAKTVYVSSTGDDTAIGDQAHPVATLPKAHTLAVAGDTVAVFSGVYTGQYSATTAFGPFKSGVLYQGYGPSMPVLDGQWRSWTVNTPQGTNLHIDKLDIRNATQTVLEAQGSNGVVSNFQLTNCHIHHADSTKGPPQTGTGWNSAVRINFGNPTVRGNEIDHVGMYNESYGIFFAQTKNAVFDSNFIYWCRKQSIRDYYSLYAQVTNNFTFSCEGGMDTMGFGSLIANNVMVQSDYGIIAKHCNNVQFLQNLWGMTQSQLLANTRIWHNTVYHSYGAHIEMAVSLTGTQPDYLELTNAQHNIFAGPSYISLYDQPAARTNTCFTDYNIHPTNLMLGQGLYRRGLSPASWTVLTLAQLRADAQTGWEQHGQQLDPTFVDAANNNLTPTVDYRAPVALASQWGDQIGARGVTPGPLKWKPEPVITITGSAGSTAQLQKIVDGYGAITNFVIATNVELNSSTAWITCDLGSSKTISAMRWTPWSHNRWDNVKDFKIEIANAAAGPWTTILTNKIPDYGGVTVCWDFGQAYTGRYVRFTALTNFLDGANRPDLVGTASDRLVFSEFEVGQIAPVGTVNPGSPPTNTALPTISGTTIQNNTLTGTNGLWSGTPTSFTYRWLRNNAAIAGATSATYFLVAADVGTTLKFEVTATNGTGSTVATSVATSTIAAPASAPTNSVIPSISGTLIDTNVVTGNPGSWTGSPTFTYRWLRDGTAAVAGQTGATYLLTGADVGHTLVFEVTGTNSVGSVVAKSGASGVISAAGTPPVSAINDWWGIQS